MGSMGANHRYYLQTFMAPLFEIGPQYPPFCHFGQKSNDGGQRDNPPHSWGANREPNL